MQRYLVVANRTLGGPQLLETIRARMSRGPAEFWVLVPATPSSRLVNDFNALSGAFPVTSDVLPGATEDARDAGVAEARLKLDTELRRLRQIGARADGAIGDADPLKAIGTALGERAFDEILLSTLPAGLSRWLARDLPRRIRRSTSVPLTVIVRPRATLAADEPDPPDPPEPPAARVGEDPPCPETD